MIFLQNDYDDKDIKVKTEKGTDKKLVKYFKFKFFLKFL
jgi:hypothetical protein